jgi:hypothetical protein
MQSDSFHSNCKITLLLAQTSSVRCRWSSLLSHIQLRLRRSAACVIVGWCLVKYKCVLFCLWFWLFLKEQLGENATEIFKMFAVAFGKQTLGTIQLFSPLLLLLPSLKVVWPLVKLSNTQDVHWLVNEVILQKRRIIPKLVACLISKKQKADRVVTCPVHRKTF